MVDILFSYKSALTKWMVARLETVERMKAFQENDNKELWLVLINHKNTKSFKTRFRNDVGTFCKELESLFEDTDNKLVSEISINVMDDNAVTSVSHIASISTKISS